MPVDTVRVFWMVFTLTTWAGTSTGQLLRTLSGILRMLWLNNNHALTASPTFYSQFPSTLLIKNHFGPSLETYFSTAFQNLCLNSAAMSPLDPVLPAVGSEERFSFRRPQARRGLSANEGCTVCPLLSHPSWSTALGRGGPSLQVAAWSIGANPCPHLQLWFSSASFRHACSIWAWPWLPLATLKNTGWFSPAMKWEGGWTQRWEGHNHSLSGAARQLPSHVSNGTNQSNTQAVWALILA